jgi:hypothetical protein
LTAYDLKNKKKIGDYLPFGNGPNEYLYLRTLQFEDSVMWTFDLKKKQVFQYNLPRLIYDNDNTPLKKITLKSACERVLVVNDELYANSLDYPDSRFSVYDEKGEFIRNMGELPTTDQKISRFEKVESYLCNMSLNPNDNSIFIAYMSTDLIEIYASDDSLKVRNHGPDHFFSVNKELSNDNLIRVRSIPNETRDAYFSPVAFEDEIWTIYSGNYFDPQAYYSFLNKRIIVFDWDGNPIRQYVTDIPFFALAIDREERYIYALTVNPEYSIIRFNYALEHKNIE